MVDFRPFRAWRYNPGVVGDLASVVCPPYDLITPELQQSLLQLSPYNVVHLEAGEGLDWNDPAEGQYRQTAVVFDEWQSQDVLRREDSPSFYLLRHTFEFPGPSQRTRLGLTGCVGLADYNAQQGLPPRIHRRTCRHGPGLSHAPVQRQLQPHHVPLPRPRRLPGPVAPAG